MENVKQLTGKGIESLEHCPPTVHFDLSADEFHRMLDNPEETLASIGVEIPRGTSFTWFAGLTLSQKPRAGKQGAKNPNPCAVTSRETAVLSATCTTNDDFEKPKDSPDTS